MQFIQDHLNKNSYGNRYILLETLTYLST